VGTLVRNLDYYEKEHLRICRPARLGMKDAQQVVRYAVSRLGVDYDVRHIFDLMRFLFPWSIMPRRWRSTLFQHHAGRSTRTVCSTMIAEAFAFVQFPILPLVKQTGNDSVQLFRRNPKLCTPSDFDYSPYFKIIKYPFVDLHYHEDHHLLPWKGGAQLDGEESELYMDAESQPRTEDVEEAISQAIADQDSALDTELVTELPEKENVTSLDSADLKKEHKKEHKEALIKGRSEVNAPQETSENNLGTDPSDSLGIQDKPRIH
jgi:hypothetical protein